MLGLSVVVALAAGLTVWREAFSDSAPAQIPLPPDPPTPKTVKLSAKGLKDIHGLIHEFVHTAVARKNLVESYRLIGPGLREDISLSRWTRGQMTVLPYPVDAKTTLVYEKPEWTYAKSVRIQMHVVTPDKPNQTAKAGPETFIVDLIKRDGRWLVNSWVPRWTPPIPNGNG